MRRAACPGSFDPVTNGHIDIIGRASRAVRRGRRRGRRERVQEAAVHRRGADRDAHRGLRAVPNVTVDSFDGLLTDFCRDRDVHAIVKGLRAVSDFDYELQMAQMNSSLSGVETVFVPTSPEYSFLASSLVKEVATLRRRRRPGSCPGTCWSG